MKSVSKEKTNEISQSARAVTRYIRISPRKIRLVLDTIRWKPVGAAFAILDNMNKKGARLVAKTLKSAFHNAKGKNMDENRLIVRYAFADGGPTLKRHLPRAMGRADTILKRTSHLTVVLEEGTARNMVPPQSKGEKPSKLAKFVKGKSGKTKEKAAGAAA